MSLSYSKNAFFAASHKAGELGRGSRASAIFLPADKVRKKLWWYNKRRFRLIQRGKFHEYHNREKYYLLLP